MALNPRQTLHETIGRPVSFYFGLGVADVSKRTKELLDLVELPLVAEEILKLLRRLQSELGLSYVLITHDLDVVHRIAHRTAVMLKGSFVAFDDTARIFEGPYHPYTEKLVTAVPVMRSDGVLAKRAAAIAA